MADTRNGAGVLDAMSCAGGAGRELAQLLADTYNGDVLMNVVVELADVSEKLVPHARVSDDAKDMQSLIRFFAELTAYAWDKQGHTDEGKRPVPTTHAHTCGKEN